MAHTPGLLSHAQGIIRLVMSLKSPDLYVSLVISLRTQVLSCADDFNHSLLCSLSQLNKESGTGNVFLLLSVQSWLSVSYSIQTPFKGKLELSQCPWARVQLAGSLCFPPVASSLPTHTHSLDASLCALTPSDQISSCFLSPFELGFTRRSHSPSHSSLLDFHPHMCYVTLSGNGSLLTGLFISNPSP